jgi:hypothetical protein
MDPCDITDHFYDMVDPDADTEPLAMPFEDDDGYASEEEREWSEAYYRSFDAETMKSYDYPREPVPFEDAVTPPPYCQRCNHCRGVAYRGRVVCLSCWLDFQDDLNQLRQFLREQEAS